jgi:hypothetical protein
MEEGSYTQDEATTMHRLLHSLVVEPKNNEGLAIIAARILADMEAKRKERKANPKKMVRTEYPENPYDNGEVTVHFTNAAHLVDTYNYAREIGMEAAFCFHIMRLVMMAAGSAIPKNRFVWHEGQEDEQVYPAQEGRKIAMTISPDGFNDPGFGWCEFIPEQPGKAVWKNLMNGGLIFHYSSADWSIHT